MPTTLTLQTGRNPADNKPRMSKKLRYLYRALRYRWQVDPAEIRFVCHSLRPGQVAVDIGCHKGAYTYWMRRSVGPKGAVFCFEPQPKQVDYLRQAFSAMRYDNVSIVPMAVSDQCGEMQLYMPEGAGLTHAASLERRGVEGGTSDESSASSTARTLTVPVTTLDDFFNGQNRKPNFLKIDVEGHELAVLQGGRATLEKHHPSILIECEARHRPDGDVRPVFEFLQSLGYTGSFFINRERQPLAAFRPDIHQRTNAADPHTLPPGYVNNFAFEAGR
jgi:FkbM family methyltransferase